MAGWIYVMSNPAMPGLLKIGRSSKEPKGDRAAELSKATGVPQPFEVEYQALVDDESREEKRLHKHFESKRVNGKEFFEGLSVSHVISAIHQLCSIKYEDNFFSSREEQRRYEAAEEAREWASRDARAKEQREEEEAREQAARLREIAANQERSDQANRRREFGIFIVIGGFLLSIFGPIFSLLVATFFPSVAAFFHFSVSYESIRENAQFVGFPLAFISIFFGLRFLWSR